MAIANIVQRELHMGGLHCHSQTVTVIYVYQRALSFTCAVSRLG